MNTVDLIKDNTDYKNQSDIYNAIVTGSGKENIPNMTTAAGKINNTFTSALAVPDVFQSGMVYNNVASSTANLACTLPAVASNTGKYLTFFTGAAYVMRVTPASGEAIYLFGDGVASKYLSIPAVVGNYATLYCDGTAWYVMASAGVIVKEG